MVPIKLVGGFWNILQIFADFSLFFGMERYGSKKKIKNATLQLPSCCSQTFTGSGCGLHKNYLFFFLFSFSFFYGNFYINQSLFKNLKFML